MRAFFSNLDKTFVVELILLAVAGPILYFPERFPSLLVGVAFGLLAATWLWRRLRLGVWRYATPVDGAVFFLVLVMLPVAVWVVPHAMRAEYTWPKVYVLLWNFCLFYTITTHARRTPHLLYLALAGFLGIGLFIGLLAPLGTNWLFKLPGAEMILSRMPSVLADLSREGASGFHPNMIAGGLLYVLPFALVLCWTLYRQGKRGLIMGAVGLTTLYLLGIFGLLQSRGGLVGLMVGMCVVGLIRFPWGRRVLLVATLAGAIAMPFFFEQVIQLISDTPTVAAVGGLNSLEGFRMMLWRNAWLSIQDFPFTGSGFGIFQIVASHLYPLQIPPSYYFGHAHNFWLQAAIDFGLPGLAALLVIYGGGLFHVYGIWQNGRADASRSVLLGPMLALGMLGSMVAHLIHGMTDSVSMGSTPNLLFWYLFALAFSLIQSTEPPTERLPATPHADFVEPDSIRS